MKIAIASDHKGFGFKETLKNYLVNAGYKIEDFGDDSMIHEDDYPDFGIPAVKSVINNKNERAVLICNNGLGMSMLANRFKGIRGTLVYSNKTASESRKHSDSNVLCLGTEEHSEAELLSFINIWLKTDFEGERHLRRLEKIDSIS